jgi:hypothetical protein
VQNESIINNDKINLPTLSVIFNDQLAGFDVFYKAPGDTAYTQLSKRLANTPPIKEPFCYYKFTNDNEIQILFTSRDNYFQPKFNSEIFIKYYTTTGSQGVFPLYKGDQVNVIPKSEVYEYNNGLIVFAVPQSESKDGRDGKSLDELQNIVVEKYSTAGSYVTENDLQLYFSNYKYRYGNQMLFVKKRDDIFQRLFTAFALMKDPNGNIYPTNTLHVNLLPNQFDIEYEQTNKFLLKAGHVFKYKGDSRDTVECIPNTMLKDDLSVLTDEFVYVNPFLMTMTKSPAVVGFYMNSQDKKLLLDYSYVNSNSVVQFICNNLFITRNALLGEDVYKLQIVLAPTMDLENPLVDENGNDLGLLKLKGMIEDSNGMEFCYTDFSLKSYDSTSNTYTFETSITTDDYMTLSQKIRVFNLKDITSQAVDIKLIPMISCKMNIYAFYHYNTTTNLNHKYSYMNDVKDYTLTNVYSTTDTKIDFITPLNIVRSQVKYSSLPNNEYDITMSFIPFIKAQTMKDPTLYSHFIDSLILQYDYMQEVLDKIMNNGGIDIKFYNTFGRSKNFVAGETNTLLDKVNCGIRFKVSPSVGTNEGDLVRDLKIFIKNYVENINTKGSNAIYISNLIKTIENNFTSVKYQKFISINNYDSSVQVIENKTLDINQMSKEERKNYVPEYLTMLVDNIYIEII